jgi:PilZ domain
MTEAQVNAGRYEDLQSAPRFPLHLSASVKAEGAAYSAQTENISANGVLFAMDKDVAVGSTVDFTIMLPADVLGTRQNVQVDCRGRVVRSFEDRGRRGVGVVIDEYHFERA